MLVLGIETSCDETAAAVIEDGRRVRSDVVASQILVHAEYGGVVPEVASRQHLATVVPVLRGRHREGGHRLLRSRRHRRHLRAGAGGRALVGVEAAKALGYALGKPVVGVNHLADTWRRCSSSSRPCRAAALSARGAPGVGRHTALFRVAGPGDVSQLGATRDDAAVRPSTRWPSSWGWAIPAG
jgi:N6-L-threonylcarbamoyladenine synthase